MIKHIVTPVAALAIFMASGVTPVEAKRVKERAELSISFVLAPADETSTASGTADIELNRENGQEETSFEFEAAGLPDGTYTVNAETATETVKITDFVVEAVVGEPTEEEAEIALPAGLDPLRIVAISVVDAGNVEVLRGEATALTTYWMYKANVKVAAPAVVAPVEPAPAPVKGKKPAKAKKVHGHVLIQALIVGDQEMKRKFLFNAQGAPASTELTLNLDGVAVATVTSSSKGKVMIKSLDANVRLAGVREVTITDAAGTVLMEAQF